MRPKNVPSQCQCATTLALLVSLVVGCSVPVETAAVPGATHSGATTTPSLTAIPSPIAVSNTLIPAFTPAPTLTAEQRKAFVLDRLTGNGGCELPCWWGIMPSEATLQTLQDQFRRPFQSGFLRQDGTVLYEANYELLNAAGQRDYYVQLGFVEQEGIIQAIEVSSQVYAMAQPGNFARDWQRYSIDQLLNQYGVPSRVQLQLVPPIEPGAPPGYALIIVYEERGFWIRYQGPATFDGTMVRACPSFAEVEYLVLRLQSSAAKTPVFRPDPDGYDRSLEEATGMSLKTFYDRFKDASAQTCLEGLPTLP